jgi:hypothetical protein
MAQRSDLTRVNYQPETFPTIYRTLKERVYDAYRVVRHTDTALNKPNVLAGKKIMCGNNRFDCEMDGIALFVFGDNRAESFQGIGCNGPSICVRHGITPLGINNQRDEGF